MLTRPYKQGTPPTRRPGLARVALRSLAAALMLSGLLASGMPAAADTGRRSEVCTCASARQADANPTGGRAVINEELSEGDDVVVEFVPSDLPAEAQTKREPVPSLGETSITGGSVENSTDIAVDASGGEADADAAGGDLNLVDVVTRGEGDVEADAGSGGTADADATGGVVVIGNVNSGDNQGSEIEVNQFSTGRILCFMPDGKAVVEVPIRLSQPAGNVQVEGGSVSNETTIAVDASGGEASADASGGSGNVVVVSGGSGDVDASAGSGGTADADASGGAVVIGDVNSGGNQGNEITVGNDSDDREQRRAERRAARHGDCVPPPCVAPEALNAVIQGGDVSNTTDIAVDASGGDAAADASGGDDNIVQVETEGGDVAVDASAGTGGEASADASGGAVEIGTVRSGGNAGNVIRFNDVGGRVLCLTGHDSLLLELELGKTGRRDGGQRDTTVSGGSVTNETTIAVDASGGEAAADASGGDGNIVVTGGSGDVDASAGSGGTASADASGGAVVIGDVNSGGNRGNDVDDDEEDDEDEED